jgi:hypothetical protein
MVVNRYGRTAAFVAILRQAHASRIRHRRAGDAKLDPDAGFVSECCKMSIEFLPESPPFADDEIVGMAHAVDDVCKVLEIPPEDAPTLKSIAERVVELAREGERDPSVLAERVISEMRPGAETSPAGMN